MENLKITNEMINNNTIIQTEMIPNRFAIATDIFLCIKDSNDSPFLLAYNYTKGKTLCPYFTSHNNTYKFTSTTCKDIIDEFNKAIEENSFSYDVRTNNTKKDIEKLLKISDVTFSSNKLLPDEYWIKYSKSSDTWTLYLIETLSIDSFSGTLDLSNLESNQMLLLPIDSTHLNNLIETEQYNGIQLVDNFVTHLKNKYLIDNLIKQAIKKIRE